MLRNLESFARFVAIVDAGTMRRAAEQIGVTQAALTRSIKILEEDLEAPLFERRGRGITLTYFGEGVYDHARQLLQDATVAASEIRALREGEQGTLRLAAAPVWMTSILPPVLASLQTSFPRLKFELEARNYSDAIPLLKSGKLDAFFGGFQKPESLPSFLVREPMFLSKLLVMARHDHPLHSQDQVVVEDLLKFPWVSFQSDVAYLGTINEAVHNTTGKAISASVNCDSMLTALELLRCGDYLSLLPDSFFNSVHGSELDALSPQIDEITFQSGPVFRRSLRDNAAFAKLLSLSKMRAEKLHN